MFIAEAPILQAPRQGVWKEMTFSKLSREAMCLLHSYIIIAVR